MNIECTVNGHKYETESLYFEDFTTLGFMTEEKVYPFLTCLTACIANNLSDSELLKALYNSCKDIFNREDLKFISNLALNKEHLRVDGKRLDAVEWEKHWQTVGFMDYRVVCFNFIRQNLGNFSSLSALLPTGWTENIKKQLENKLSVLFTNLSGQLQK
nr:MAG TPA: hypothetical protein [Caudoviricetes sp.]